MFLLILGLVLFLGIHSISIVATGWRDAQAARLGENAWKGIYTLLSLAGFALIVIGYGQARQAPLVLYVPPVALRHVAALLMLPVFVLLVAAYMPGRIQSAAKHPMLVATKLWATAHLLANGTLADVLLFGGFLAWAVADRISMKRRTQRPLPGAPAGRFNDAIALVLGLALYVGFVAFGHRWLIGVSPF
ncbi:MAG: NnrU family protein [Burkholderiaceae bacterium]|nr:MAG: NnrU family protein [Burkholderiaceae bacterium]